MAEDISSTRQVDPMQINNYSNQTTGNVKLDFIDLVDSYKSRYTIIYGAPPIVILGTIGNILSAVVMNRKSLRASTTSLYLTVLAVSDLFCLYMGLVPHWIRYKFNYYIGYVQNTGCTTYWAVLYFAFHYEAWVLVSVSLERFVAVWFPTKHKILFTLNQGPLSVY